VGDVLTEHALRQVGHDDFALGQHLVEIQTPLGLADDVADLGIGEDRELVEQGGNVGQ
jgi:hypothetical protein